MVMVSSKVDVFGKILIPYRIRKDLGLEKNSHITINVRNDGVIEVKKYSDVVDEVRDLISKYNKDGISLTHELKKMREEDAKIE